MKPQPIERPSWIKNLFDMTLFNAVRFSERDCSDIVLFFFTKDSSVDQFVFILFSPDEIMLERN